MNSQDKPHVGAVLIAYNAAGTLEHFYKEFPKEAVRTIVLVESS
jgi:hypothetical protein